MNPQQGVWSLVSGAEMQALDRHTIETLGVSGEILMESAGRALLAPCLRLRAESGSPGQPVVILSGPGNNGGDGFVLARHLAAEGIDFRLFRVGVRVGIRAGDAGARAEKSASDATVHWERLARVEPARIADADEGPSGAPEAALSSASVVVDALFGTGLSRPLTDQWESWIAAIAQARAGGAKVLAVDLPSGICADTGQVLGVAVEADATVTISAPKIGLMFPPGRILAGVCEVARIGISDELPEATPPVHLWSARAAVERWPTRPKAGHKGSFGRVLVAGGSSGLLGATSLSARGALRAGAGLVTVAYPAVHRLSDSSRAEAGGAGSRPDVPVEAMTHALPATDVGTIDRLAMKELLELAAARDAVAFGPGLGRDQALRSWVPEFVESISAPLVLDADGLHVYAGQPERLRERSGPTVLTPHPGEAATLLESDTATLGRDRLGSARELAHRSGCVVVLKGAGTVVAKPDGAAMIIPTGGPILASGGTGDVLTGILVALLSRGGDAFEAAGLAAWWHGATADRLSARSPGGFDFGMLASELADALPETVQTTRCELENEEGERRHDTHLLRFP